MASKDNYDAEERRTKLCAQCANFDIRGLFAAFLEAPKHKFRNGRENMWDGVSRYHVLKPSLHALKTSAASCTLCSAIWAQISEFHGGSVLAVEETRGKSIDHTIYLEMDTWEQNASRAPHLMAVQYSADDGDEQPEGEARGRRIAYFEVCSSPGLEPDDPLFDQALGRVQASSAGDPSCIDLAKLWLKECSEEHRLCRHSLSLTLPTRVLDVGEKDAQVRLVDGISRVGRYAAVSYCWGGERGLCLERSTEKMLRDGVGDVVLPQTLRDAARVARDLGVRYLWIDALCIRQDDLEDWANEAARMGEVYQRALVTLEAASSTRPSEGFLKQRVSSKPYVELQWRGAGCGTAAVQLRPFYDINDTQLTGTVLFSRGWTMQERLLAPRTLSFGVSQMSFECAEGYRDEARKHQTSPSIGMDFLRKRNASHIIRGQSWLQSRISWMARLLGVPCFVATPWAKLAFQGDLALGRHRRGTYFDFWRTVVQYFSRRNLTHVTDRLPALSGVAKQIQMATGDAYYAGHWWSDMLWSLSWAPHMDVVNVNGHAAKRYADTSSSRFVSNWPHDIRLAQFVAPSWSWASVRTDIAWIIDKSGLPFRAHVPLAKIVWARTEPAFTDPLGRLNSGFLDISAPVLQLPNMFEPCNESYSYAKLHSWLRRAHFQMNDDYAHEPYQQHVAHADQQFALLQLFTMRGTAKFEVLLVCLLLETCGDGSWRRLCRVMVQIEGVREELEENMQMREVMFVGGKRVSTPFDWTDKARRAEYIEKVADDIRSAPWRVETLRLM